MAASVSSLRSQNDRQDLSAIPNAVSNDAHQAIAGVATATLAAIPPAPAPTRVVQFPHGSRTVLQNGVLVQVPLPTLRRPVGVQTLQGLPPQEDPAINEMRETVRNTTESLRETSESLRELGDRMEADAPKIQQVIADTQQMRADTRTMTERLDRLIGSPEERAARAVKDAEQIAALEEINRCLDQKFGTDAIDLAAALQETVQIAPIANKNPNSFWENWKEITGIALRIITLLAIAALYGITPAALVGGGMIMEIGFGWIFNGKNSLENPKQFLTSNDIQPPSIEDDSVPSHFQNLENIEKNL